MEEVLINAADVRDGILGQKKAKTVKGNRAIFVLLRYC
jgi:hypothetical protein